MAIWESSERRTRARRERPRAGPSSPQSFYKHYGGTTADGKNGHIYRSTERGASWSTQGQVETTKRGPGALAIHPTDSTTLYCGDCTGTYGGLWKSTHGAVSFTKVGSSPGRMCRMQRGGRWLYGTDNPNNGDLHRYNMGSASWETLHDGQIAGFRVHPNDDQIIFACNGTHDHMYSTAPKGQLEKTTDGGATWFDVQDGAGQDFGPWDVWIDPDDTDHMMMSAVHHDEANGTSSGIMESVDGGETWSSIRGAMPSLRVSFFEGEGGSRLGNPMGIYEIWMYRWRRSSEPMGGREAVVRAWHAAAPARQRCSSAARASCLGGHAVAVLGTGRMLARAMSEGSRSERAWAA